MKLKWILPWAALTAIGCSPQYRTLRAEPEKNISIGADLPEDAGMKAVIAPYKQGLETRMNEKIAETAVNLSKDGQNSNLGNLLADFTFEAGDAWLKKNGHSTGADAAVINIGGIRSAIGKGDILMKHIYEIMPFENEVMVVKIPGSQMPALFDYFVNTQKNNPVSHLYIETDGGKSVKNLINNSPIDPAKDYYIVTSDYLALGGDNMAFFGKGEMISTGIKLRDLFIEKFRERRIIPDAPVEQRLNFKNSPSK